MHFVREQSPQAQKRKDRKQHQKNKTNSSLRCITSVCVSERRKKLFFGGTAKNKLHAEWLLLLELMRLVNNSTSPLCSFRLTTEFDLSWLWLRPLLGLRHPRYNILAKSLQTHCIWWMPSKIRSTEKSNAVNLLDLNVHIISPGILHHHNHIHNKVENQAKALFYSYGNYVHI